MENGPRCNRFVTNFIGETVIWSAIPKRQSMIRRPFVPLSARMFPWARMKSWTNIWNCGRPIEVFFRQSKGRLAFGRYQIRSSKGIQRYWLLMSLAHFIACTGNGKPVSFEDGYAYFYRRLQEERIAYVYQCGKKQIPFADVLELVA